MTIFLVEQNANQALKLADRGYVLENGRVVLQDTGRPCWPTPPSARPISAAEDAATIVTPSLPRSPSGRGTAPAEEHS